MGRPSVSKEWQTESALKNLEQLVDAHDDLIRSTFNKTVKRSIFREVEEAYQMDRPGKPTPVSRHCNLVFDHSLRGELAQCPDQSLHLFQGVVMYQTDAQHSAFLLHLKALRQIECVVVPVPGKDAALGEKFGNRLRRMIPDAERECRAAFLKSLRVGDPEDAGFAT